MTRGGHEQGEGEREQDEAPRGHWPTSVPDRAPNDNPGGSLDDVGSGRRLTVLVVALALVGAPAVALTAFCVGQSCADEDQAAAARSLLCRFPAICGRRSRPGSGRGVRRTSWRRRRPTSGDLRRCRARGGRWPSTTAHRQTTRPDRVLRPRGRPRRACRPGPASIEIAPTIARMHRIRTGRTRRCGAGRRSRSAVPPVRRPTLVVEIVWKGVGSDAFDAAGFRRGPRRLVAADGAATLHGDDRLAPGRPRRDPHDDRHRRPALPARDHRHLIRDRTAAASPAWSAGRADVHHRDARPTIGTTLTASGRRIGLVARIADRPRLDRRRVVPGPRSRRPRDRTGRSRARPSVRLLRCRVRRRRRRPTSSGVVLSGSPAADGSRDGQRSSTPVAARVPDATFVDHRDRGRATARATAEPDGRPRRRRERSARRSSPAVVPGGSSWIKPSWPRTTSRPTTSSARWTR